MFLAIFMITSSVCFAVEGLTNVSSQVEERWGHSEIISLAINNIRDGTTGRLVGLTDPLIIVKNLEMKTDSITGEVNFVRPLVKGISTLTRDESKSNDNELVLNIGKLDITGKYEASGSWKINHGKGTFAMVVNNVVVSYDIETTDRDDNRGMTLTFKNQKIVIGEVKMTFKPKHNYKYIWNKVVSSYLQHFQNKFFKTAKVQVAIFLHKDLENSIRDNLKQSIKDMF